MRERGKQIYWAVLGGDRFELPVNVTREGKAVAESPDFRYTKAQEITYTAKNPFGDSGNAIAGTWIRLRGGRGVTILPIIDLEGQKMPLLILKPQPSVESWSIELISGGITGADKSINDAVQRELREESGFTASKVSTLIGDMWHAPFRLSSTDSVMIAEDLVFVGRKVVEREEAPITPFIATWSEVMDYLRENAIKYGMTIAALSTYILSHDSMQKLLRKE